VDVDEFLTEYSFTDRAVGRPKIDEISNRLAQTLVFRQLKFYAGAKVVLWVCENFPTP
jgi:hypothetical protein